MNKLLQLFGVIFCLINATGTLRADLPTVRVMPLGDSQTSGYTVTNSASGYRSKLYESLIVAGYNPDLIGTLSDTNAALADHNHEGHNGYRIDQIDSALDGWFNKLDAPDVILLLIGANDFNSIANESTNALERLDSLITHMATQRPFAKIIVANLLARSDDAGADQSCQTNFNAFLPALVDAQAALGRQVSFVDMRSSVSLTDLSSDGFHPNQTGYEKMADTWFTAITNVISPFGTTNPPAIMRGVQDDFTHITLTFSKPVDDAVTNLSNFSLDGGVMVLLAQLDPVSKRIVTLTTSPQAQNTLYTLSVSGVHDRTPEQNQIASGSTVSFQSEMLANGSFESDYSGWSATGNYGIASPNEPFPPSDGLKLFVFNWGQLTPNGTLSQSFTTVPGQIYVLNYDVGVIAYNLDEQRMKVTVEGATPLLVETNSLFGQGGGTAFWTPQSYTFIADSTNTLLTFYDVSPATTNLDLMLDHVRVTPLILQTLTVTSTPVSALTAVVIPTDYNGNSNGVTGFSRLYPLGTIATVSVPATAGLYVFQKWQRDGVDFSTNETVSVSIDADHALSAVYVAAPPFITAAPLSLTASAGKTARFNATAEGLAPLAYQWRLNGTNLPGAISSSYSITNVQTINAGNYDVLVSNAGGSTASVIAALTVLPYGILANGSFESDYEAWTATGNFGIASPTEHYPPSDGQKLFVFNWGQLNPSGVVSQSFVTTPGQSYVLQYDVGVIGFNRNEQRLQTTVQGVNLLLSKTNSIFCLGNGAALWVAQNYTFVADSSVTTLTFSDISLTSTDVDLMLDHVQITTDSTALTVSSSPDSGVEISMTPADASGAADGITGFSRAFDDASTTVFLSAPPSAAGRLFLKWQKDGVDLSTNTVATVTMDASHTLNAVYAEAVPLTATVVLTNLNHTYDGTGKSATASTDPEDLSVDLTYNGSVIPPTNAGIYEVIGMIAELNYTGSATNILVISPALATVTLTNLSHIYDANGKSAIALTTPTNLNVILTYDGSTAEPTNSGNYEVIGTVADANYTGSATNTLVVSKANLAITADDASKLFGQMDPQFTAHYNGFVDGQNASVLNGTLQITREPGEVSGTYAITPSGVTAENYTIGFYPGTFSILPVDAPVILSLTGAGTADVVIQWTAVSNVNYRVQFRAAINTGEWTDISPDVISTNTTASTLDHPGTDPQRFYRVIIPMP